ncbi:MAG: hypothetical protein RL367_518 [Pseudomonadota bacterium]
MSGNFALDTNIAVYAFSEDARCEVALGLLSAGPMLSIQLLNEFTNVSLRKRKIAWAEISESLDIIRQFASSLRTMTLPVHTLGVEISQRHSLSFYDSLMLAAALLDGCETFYREDMQNGLVIDGRLTITNPFLAQPEP